MVIEGKWKPANPKQALNRVRRQPPEGWDDWIGRRVCKTSLRNKEPKPFKSGSKVNTVKNIIEHPIVGGPAFTFHEDDSYVACWVCQIA